MNTIIDTQKPLSYDLLTQYTNRLKEAYNLPCVSIGKSYLGRDIWSFVIGSGKKKSVYVGGHHGSEWITSLILLDFLEDILFCQKNALPFLRNNTELYFKLNEIHIIPMLNADGCDLAVSGISADSPFYEKLIKINGGSDDFHTYQANAKGVDLNRNYNAAFDRCKSYERQMGITAPAPTRFGGDYPFSEPETAAMAKYCAETPFDLAVALHSQGEEIYYSYENLAPKNAVNIARIMAQVSGYTLSEPETVASCGGFKDYMIAKYNIPAFTIEVGKGKNPLPLTQFDDIYKKLRKILFFAPIS